MREQQGDKHEGSRGRARESREGVGGSTDGSSDKVEMDSPEARCYGLKHPQDLPHSQPLIVTGPWYRTLEWTRVNPQRRM